MKNVNYTVSDDGCYKYILLEKIRHYSVRYDKYITVPAMYRSDGATGALDINSCAWWIHDRICDHPFWDDGTPIPAWTAAMVLSDELFLDNYKIRSIGWFWATFFFGCHKARSNGWF